MWLEAFDPLIAWPEHGAGASGVPQLLGSGGLTVQPVPPAPPIGELAEYGVGAGGAPMVPVLVCANAGKARGISAAARMKCRMILFLIADSFLP